MQQPDLASSRRKVLLMGSSGSGKTSMRSIIFANVVPRETSHITATVSYEQHGVKFLGDLSLNLWDCGGQVGFMESYFAQAEQVFSNVACLIYVFDVEDSEPAKSLGYFRRTCEALARYSPTTNVFALVHKMDLVPERQARTVFDRKTNEVTSAAVPLKPRCFATTIWNESLYDAWSAVVNSLIPRRELLVQQLQTFADVCDAREVLLFERSTFLVVAAASPQPPTDAHRFEKLSNIIKQFKLSCSRHSTQSEHIEISNSQFSALLALLTPHSVLLVVNDRTVQPETVNVNIVAARPHFQKVFESLRM